MPHTYCTNLDHCVFSTKLRVNLITDDIQERLFAYILGIAKNLHIEITGFGAFSVSPSQASTVKQYIRTQAEHHKKRTFEEEFLLLLKKSGIEYDPKYAFG